MQLLHYNLQYIPVNWRELFIGFISFEFVPNVIALLFFREVIMCMHSALPLSLGCLSSEYSALASQHLCYVTLAFLLVLLGRKILYEC